MKIEISDSLKGWIEQQVEFGDYASADANVEAVLLRDQKRWRAAVEKKLLEALDSGDPIEVYEEFWEDQRRQLEESLQKSHGAPS